MFDLLGRPCTVVLIQNPADQPIDKTLLFSLNRHSCFLENFFDEGSTQLLFDFHAALITLQPDKSFMIWMFKIGRKLHPVLTQSHAIDNIVISDDKSAGDRCRHSASGPHDRRNHSMTDQTIDNNRCIIQFGQSDLFGFACLDTANRDRDVGTGRNHALFKSLVSSFVQIPYHRMNGIDVDE